MNKQRSFNMVILSFIAVGCLSVLLFLSLPNTALWSAIQNVGHSLLFLFMAVAFIFHLDKLLRCSYLFKLLLAFFVLSVIGVVAEGVQYFMPFRNASVEDIWSNTLGISLGLVLYTCYRYRRIANQSLVIFSFVLTLSAIVWACRPVIEIVGYSFLKSKLPVVVSFNDPFIETAITTTGGTQVGLVKMPDGIVSHGGNVLRISFSEQQYSGVVFQEPRFPEYDNWELEIHLVNTEKTDYKLKLRIHDAQHGLQYEDRFNTTLAVSPGHNKLVIPRESIVNLANGRFMDMQKISALQLFSTNRSQFTLYLAGIKIIE